MKPNRLRTLRAGIRLVLCLCVLLLAYMLVAIPEARAPWGNNRWAEEQIQSAETLEQLQQIARTASHSTAITNRTSTGLLLTFLIATVGVILFLFWALFMIGRIKEEDTSDHAA